ncbi:MAG TPA: hypothetical protein VIK30_01900, partial [Polyangia bacterium]
MQLEHRRPGRGGIAIAALASVLFMVCGAACSSSGGGAYDGAAGGAGMGGTGNTGGTGGAPADA